VRMIEVLTTNFDAYIHSPLRALITTVGASAAALNIADSWHSKLPEWMQVLVNAVMSFPYMGLFSAVAVFLLVLERIYTIRIRRIELKKLQQQIKRGEV